MWVVFIVACIPPIRKLLVIAIGKLNATIALIAGRSHHSSAELRSGGTPDGFRQTQMTYAPRTNSESEEQILPASMRAYERKLDTECSERQTDGTR